MNRTYYKKNYKDNPLSKLWDEEAVNIILSYLQDRPYLRLQVLKELVDCEYQSEIAKREKEYQPYYGIAGSKGRETVVVKVIKPAAKGA